MSLLRAAFAVLVVIALSACATPYGPAASSGDDGYSETRIEADRWKVEVTGNASTDRETVERHVLRRAAELTLQSGAERFAMISREATPITYYVPVVATAPRPTLLFGHRDRRNRHDRLTDPFGWRREERLARMGVWGTQLYGHSGRTAYLLAGPQERPVVRWRASAEIVLLSGPDTERPDARDARAVLEQLDGQD